MKINAWYFDILILKFFSHNFREKEHQEWLDRERDQVDEIRAKQDVEDEKQRHKEEAEVSA